jgi:hypothetical protein
MKCGGHVPQCPANATPDATAIADASATAGDVTPDLSSIGLDLTHLSNAASSTAWHDDFRHVA